MSTQTEHVESLTLWEWVGLLSLLVVLGGFMSYSAMYQGFKLGQFDSGGTVAMIMAFPIVRYLICRFRPGRAVHITNHLQTAVSAAGSSVGMGSMLLAFEWTAGKSLAGWEVAAIAFPMSIFGILAANLFSESWINKQKLSFPGGMVNGSMLNGLGQGGNTLHMLVVGITVALPLVVWESPLGALAVGSGWIIGWEVMGWAMVTAFVCLQLEPTMVEYNLIPAGAEFRKVTMYFGAVAIIVAGLIDMAFIYFSKNQEGDNPDFTEREGFMELKQNLLWLGGTAVVMAIAMQIIFGLPWYITIGVCGLLVVLVYIGGTCTGKTNVGPVSALSGGVILLITSLKFGGAQALTYGAGAGQALSNGMDAGHDFRAGERVGSSLILQRKLQFIGAAFGGSIVIGSIYSLMMKAYGSKLTEIAVTAVKGQPEPEFNAGFAMKYKAFLHLGEKLSGTVGTVCLWVVVAVLVLQVVKNVLKVKGHAKIARVVPSVYACAMALFIPFSTTKQQFIGAIIAVVCFGIWSLFGKKANAPMGHKRELHLMGLNWEHVIGLAGGLVVGETLVSFVDALLIVNGIEGTFTSYLAKIGVECAFALVACMYILKSLRANKENTFRTG